MIRRAFLKNLYSKKFKTLPQQIGLLEERGLKFKDTSFARQMLLEKNYFDIINGFETLLLKDPKGKEKEYESNVNFDHFLELYDFDKELNSTVLKAIDKFETRLKSSIAYRFSEFTFGKSTNNDPASYTNILMYDDPYSIHNRINTLANRSITDYFVEDINKDISYINREVVNIERKISTCNNNEIEYINKKMRNQLLRIINKCNDSLTNTKDAIASVNSDISATPAVSNSQKRIDLISNIQETTIRLNLVDTSTGSTNRNLVQEKMKKAIKRLKECKVRLDKIYSQIVANNNRTINNVAHNELERFSTHKIFKIDYKGNKNYIENSKIYYSYLKAYEIPPFWVIIKTLELGSVLKLMYGLKSKTLDKVIKDMGLSKSEKNILFNSIKIITDLRNHCAHFSLINRYRTNPNIRITGDLKNKLNLKTKTSSNKLSKNTYYEIRLYDTLQVLSQFEDLSEIGSVFNETFNISESLINSDLLDKLLKRMGNDDLKKWCNF